MLRMILRSKIAFALIFIALILLFGFGLPRLVFYHQGWEIKSEIVAIDHEGKIITDLKSLQHTSGSGGDRWNRLKNIYGPSLWRFDLDNSNYGLPDLEITVSDIRKKEGFWPYADLEQVYEGYKYVVTFREYLFDVQVRTIADVERHSVTPALITRNEWEHETAMPYMWHSNLDGTGGDKVGKAFTGSVYIRFAVHPWGLIDFGDPPENYTFKSYWAGVMNVKMESKDTGKVLLDSNLPDWLGAGTNLPQSENHQGWVKGLPSDGAQLNMLLDDGSFGRAYSEVPWDPAKVLDPDIKSVVIVQIPFEIMAGAYENFDEWYWVRYGNIADLKPVDYWFTATIRMETFIVKEYQAREPGISPDPSPIQPPQDYYPVHIPSFWEQYGIWIIIAIIIIIIIIAAFSIFGGLGIGGILFGIFRLYRGDYG